ncbi:MAG: hypothetical protein LBQ43_03560 [Holosporales bacterium]|nr:hypothetical protein [Holosporales bacterium]
MCQAEQCDLLSQDDAGRALVALNDARSTGSTDDMVDQVRGLCALFKQLSH